MTSTDTEQLAAIRATADYQDFLREGLAHDVKRVAEAQAALNEAEDTRRVQAAIAVRGGFGKTATANVLGISRPTLDKWLADVEGDDDLRSRVDDHEQFLVRHAQRELAKLR